MRLTKSRKSKSSVSKSTTVLRERHLTGLGHGSRGQNNVTLDGAAVTFQVHVASGSPRGTVLGLLMFLVYVNDIGDPVSSNIKLFAGDFLLL